ncbi:unnamed protein product, partial [Rotaria sp. Silwood1]
FRRFGRLCVHFRESPPGRGGTSISIPGGDSRKWTHSRAKRRKY